MLALRLRGVLSSWIGCCSTREPEGTNVVEARDATGCACGAESTACAAEGRGNRAPLELAEGAGAGNRVRAIDALATPSGLGAGEGALMDEAAGEGSRKRGDASRSAAPPTPKKRCCAT